MKGINRYPLDENTDKFMQCINQPIMTPLKVTSNLDDLSDALGCTKDCPSNSSILDNTPPKQNYLAFSNLTSWGIGRCRGHSIVTQQFNALAIWDKEGKHASDCGPLNMSKICKAYYKQIIKDIIKFKVASIPGFKNLYEFSSHPDIAPMLKDHVKAVPHTYYSNGGYLSTRTGNNHLDIFLELKHRIKNSQEPSIAIKSSEISDHAITAYDIKSIGDKDYICIRDPNVMPSPRGTDIACDTYLHYENGKVLYKTSVPKGEHKLTKLILAQEEDWRTVKYVDARRKYCIEEKQKGNECPFSVL